MKWFTAISLASLCESGNYGRKQFYRFKSSDVLMAPWFALERRWDVSGPFLSRTFILKLY